MTLSQTQSTLFFPLLGRASASQKWPELFQDPWAEQAQRIVHQEGTTVEELKGFPALVYGVRHHLTILEVTQYLSAHPTAAVVNIGCGLDRLEEDLAEIPHGPLYNVDFPEVIELRTRWLPAGESVDVAYDATDVAWMDQIDASGGFIAIAPGVMYYIEVPAARHMIEVMADKFPGGRFVYDAESPFMTRQSEKQIARSGSTASMPFKINDPFEVQDWSHNIESVQVEFNFSHYLPKQQRKQLPRLHRFIFKAQELVKGMYVVRLNFASV